MPSFRCSVIIPTFNRKELLKRTLTSLLAQSLEKDAFEVIVVDDGSSDGTEDAVKSFASLLNIFYFYQERDGYRAAKARNVGICNARSDICVLVDSGVVLARGNLESFCTAHQTTSCNIAAIGYVYCFQNEAAFVPRLAENDVVVDDKSVDEYIASIQSRPEYQDIREIFYARYGDDFSYLPAPWIVFWTCNVSIRTEALKATGLFDEEFRSWGAEDVDLGYRLHRNGVAMRLCREAKSVHLPHPRHLENDRLSNASNYNIMVRKYNNEIISLLPEHGHYMALNEEIRKRGLTSSHLNPEFGSMHF